MASSKKAVSCPVETTLRVVGGQWKVLVIHELLKSTRRFNALHRTLPGISNRTLVRQLRQLEADGVVERTVFAQVPPKVEYALTPLGRSLEPILLAMAEWGESYDARTAAADESGQGDREPHAEERDTDPSG